MVRKKKKDFPCRDKLFFVSLEEARTDAETVPIEGNWVWRCGWCGGYHRGVHAMYGFGKEWVPSQKFQPQPKQLV